MPQPLAHADCPTCKGSGAHATTSLRKPASVDVESGCQPTFLYTTRQTPTGPVYDIERDCWTCGGKGLVPVYGVAA